jgi:hypothetical protein
MLPMAANTTVIWHCPKMNDPEARVTAVNVPIPNVYPQIRRWRGSRWLATPGSGFHWTKSKAALIRSNHLHINEFRDLEDFEIPSGRQQLFK